VGVSRHTLLRGLRRQPALALPTPRVLGVDDFALRKRHTYGTILVDLERRQPVELLPDRTAETVAQWLRAHPGVEVIARDRSSTYAEGARQGASEAIQVADRFHLLQNLRETLDEGFTTHHHALDAVNAAARQQPYAPGWDAGGPGATASHPRSHRATGAQRAAQRQALYEQVWALHRQGWTVVAIAAQVGAAVAPLSGICVCRRAVRQHRSHYGRSVLNPYKDYLRAWNAAATPPSNCFDLQLRGYPGSYRRVIAYVSRSPGPGPTPPPGRRQSLPVVASRSPSP
jgi:transposase